MMIEKTATICILLLSILLIALQLNSIRFTPAFAQLGGPDGENINLSGIWGRSDEYYPDETLVYINQEGTQITATFDPEGFCWENPDNPTEDTIYASTQLEFRGSLVADTIQGEGSMCITEKRTIELYDLQLRVSSDGKTLDGYTTYPDGRQDYVVYTFVSPPTSSVDINADRSVYDFKETVEISGQITNMVNGRSDAFIEVYGPEDEQVFSQTVVVNPDGSFFTSFDLNNNEANRGIHRAIASYVGANDETTFEVGVNQLPVVAIATGATIAAAGGGGVLLYKKVYVKGTKHGSAKLSIIDLRIECGLENPEVIERETSRSDNNMIIGELTEMEQRFSQAINKILENRKKIKNVQKDIEFIKWCKEAKEDPNKILSKISEEVIGKFLSSIQPYFQNLMLSQISIESDISVTKYSPKKIRKNISSNLNPIQAYIALVVYNNGLPVSSTKFIFAINSYVKIKNLTVYLEKLNRHQAQLKQQLEQQVKYRDEESGNDDASIGRRRIEIEGLLFGISIEFSRIKIGHIEKPIEPPIGLGKKEVEIKKNIFFSSQEQA